MQFICKQPQRNKCKYLKYRIMIVVFEYFGQIIAENITSSKKRGITEIAIYGMYILIYLQSVIHLIIVMLCQKQNATLLSIF
jgi:hypothetical protein